MKPQFQHTLVTSFYLWFDNHLQKRGEAYKNKTGVFYNMSDDRLDDTYNVYSSPYKQFVVDSGLNTSVVDSQGTAGATVIDRISGTREAGTTTFEITRGTSGLKIDYENGRVFFTGDAAGNLPGNGLSISGGFAVKDFNLYMTNQTEEDLVEKLRKDDYGEDDKNTSDEWLVNNAFQLGWVSNFSNLLDGFLYFENDKESNKWWNEVSNAK